ncbi:MAG: hypothetical protein WHS86_06400 [Desulfosoma sp.]
MVIPELVKSESSRWDIHVRRGPVFYRLKGIEEDGYKCAMTANEAYLEWKIVGRFAILNGKHITVDPAPGVDESVIRVPLLGMVMAVALMQRGLLVLHGSVLGMGKTAVAFLGDKGFGKSTLAAALYARGHRLISDDILAITASSAKRPRVWPAFPQFKLWPEVIPSIFGLKAEELPRVHPEAEKRILTVAERFERQVLPLSRIYILDAGPCARIESLPPQEALMEIIKNSYLARFSDQADRSAEALQLRGCSNLLKFASVFRLIHCFSLSKLEELVEMVEEHAGTATHSTRGLQRRVVEEPVSVPEAASSSAGSAQP